MYKAITESFNIKQKQEFQKQLFWPNLKNGPFNKFEDPVCCIKFCQAQSNFAMASGFQVEIRDPLADNAALKTFHRFKSPVRTLGYSSNGGLLAVGESSGQVSVYSVAMRTELRKMLAHTSAVSGLAFLAPDGGAAPPRLASCAEDGRCLLWDVSDPQSQPLAEFSLPTEDAAAVTKATCLDASQSDCNLFACGTSNGLVALFDSRQPGPALVVPRVALGDGQASSIISQPISAVRMAPGGNALYLACDSWVRAVSLHQGGRQIAAYRRHHKLVTDLAVGRGALLSCGLDGLVKVTDLLTYEEVHKFEYPNSGLLCMSLCGSGLPDSSSSSSSSSSCLALGTSDHWLLTRMFQPPDAAASSGPRQQVSQDPYLARVRAHRAARARPEDTVESPKVPGGSQGRPALDGVDRLVRGFRHSAALSLLLAKGHARRKPHRAAALVRELARRGALAAAVAGRGDKETAVLAKFALHSLGRGELGRDGLALAWDLVEAYGPLLGQRPQLVGLFQRLRALLAKEIDLSRDLMLSMGRIDLTLQMGCGGGVGGL